MSETPPIRSPPFFSSFSNSPPFIYLLQITKTTQRLWKSAHMAKAIVHISAKEEAKQQKGEKKIYSWTKTFTSWSLSYAMSYIYIYIYIYVCIYIGEQLPMMLYIYGPILLKVRFAYFTLAISSLSSVSER